VSHAALFPAAAAPAPAEAAGAAHEFVDEYLLSAPLEQLMEMSAKKRDEAFGKVVTFSPKVHRLSC